MNRTDLEALSYLRMQEARVLLAAAQPSGAYYLAGYAVECALKACIAKKTQLHDFPDRKRVDDSYTHNLQKLLGLAGLEESWRERCKDSQSFDTYWNYSNVVRRSTLPHNRSRRRSITAGGDHKRGQWSTAMAIKTLVTTDLERSQRIVERLEQDGIHIALAFWATLAEYGDWRLFLAGPQLDELGLFQAYGQIAAAGLGEEVFNEPLIVILHMDDPLTVGLLDRYKGRNVRGLALSGQSFGARSIEDGVLEKAA